MNQYEVLNKNLIQYFVLYFKQVFVMVNCFRNILIQFIQ